MIQHQSYKKIKHEGMEVVRILTLREFSTRFALNIHPRMAISSFERCISLDVLILFYSILFYSGQCLQYILSTQSHFLFIFVTTRINPVFHIPGSPQLSLSGKTDSLNFSLATILSLQGIPE